MKIAAFHINPTTQTITEVEVEQHSLDDIYRIIQAQVFDVTRLSTGDMVYVDDEGLLNGAPMTHGMFIIKGDENYTPRPLAGHALVMGSDRMGNSANAAVTLDDLQHMIEFASLDDIRKRAQRGEFD